MEILNRLMENADQIISVLGSIVILCSIVVAGTKTPDPNTIWGKLYRVVEFLALVVGKTKDKGDK